MSPLWHTRPEWGTHIRVAPALSGHPPVTTYAYDNLNRLTSLTDFNSNQFGFTYDALSRRTQLSRPNGVNTDYAYDAVGNRLSDLTTANWARNLTSVLISGVTHV